MALLAPRQVKALVLSGVKAGHNPDPTFRDEALRVLDEAGIDAAWDRYWKPLFGPGTDDGVVRHARDVARSQGALAIANGVKAFHSRPDRDGFLDSWRGPVWMVTGEHDIRHEQAGTSVRKLPVFHFREVSGAGHYVPLEAPHQLSCIVAEAVRAAEAQE